MSHRLEQLTSAIERGVREVFARGFSDPRIGGLITVTSVRVLPDLSQAVINVSVLPQEKAELTLHGLSSAAKHIRHEVGEIVNTRTLPHFAFRLDSTLKKEAAILKELDKVRQDLATRPPPPPEPEGNNAESPPGTPGTDEGNP
ncbi:MAG TPA: 30S ribosome-binding factor RbfA [Phycisphaerales bacterium]|nr:30S ribosome-binding factor RbfA [Phycisphaerales bacterium]